MRFPPFPCVQDLASFPGGLLGTGLLTYMATGRGQLDEPTPAADSGTENALQGGVPGCIAYSLCGDRRARVKATIDLAALWVHLEVVIASRLHSSFTTSRSAPSGGTLVHSLTFSHAQVASLLPSWPRSSVLSKRMNQHAVSQQNLLRH